MPRDAGRRDGALEWLDRARSNLIRASMPKPEGVLWEDVCFDLEQATEKSLKAVLVYYNVDFPRTHHIEWLIALIRENGIPWPDEFDEAAGMTIYAVQARYPGAGFVITDAHFQKAIKIAKKLVDWAGETFQG
jgi:HEPN domain-containing protein